MKPVHQRIVSAVVGVPLIIMVLYFPWTFIFKMLVLTAAILALFEFYRCALPGPVNEEERRFGLFAGGLYGFLMIISSSARFSLFPAILLVILVFMFAIFRVERQGQAAMGVTERLGLHLLGAFYIVGFTLFIGFLRDCDHGVFWVLALFVGTWLNDTAAFIVGHRFGKNKLAPHVSPGKTVEGVVGGVLGSAVGLFGLVALFQGPLAWFQTVILVLIMSLAGPLGDLSESIIKRSFQVKDSGTLVPGHGGVWDRIDALIFNAPFVYYFAQFIQ